MSKGKQRKLSQLAMMLLVFLLGGVCAATFSSARLPGAIAAEVRQVAPRDHFKSGGERSVAILKEIADSLVRIEKRVEKIEQHLRDSENQP